MSAQPHNKVWQYEGKAFMDVGLGFGESIVTFTGDDALAKAEGWWEEQLRSSSVNALYLYECRQDGGTETKHMVKSWSTPYGYDGEPDPDDDDPDYWDPDEWDEWNYGR